MDTASTAERKFIHVLWLANAMLVAFIVPWTVTRAVPLDHRAVVGVSVISAAVFTIGYVRSARPSRSTVMHRTVPSLLLGACVGGALAVVLVLRLDPTARPNGLDLGFAILGRGVAHGVAIAAMTVGIPIAVANELVVDVPAAFRTIARVAVSLVFVWGVTSAHHLGYAQYEGVDSTPARSTTLVTSIPALVTANPAGAVVATVATHVTVTVHAFENPQLVPPRLDVVRRYEPPGLFPPELRPMGDLIIG